MTNQIRKICFPEKSYLEACSDNSVVYRVDFADGIGRMTAYPVMPGITLLFNDFYTSSGFANESHRAGMVEINYCRVGRYECLLRDGRIVSLGPQDFSMNDMGHPPRESSFTLGEYHGISLAVAIDEAQKSLVAMLGDNAPCLKELFEQILLEQSVLILRANPRVQRLFSDLYEAPEFCQTAYFKLKTAELFLFLSGLNDQAPEGRVRYVSRDLSRRIRDIEQFMTRDLRVRIPITELASRFKISETTIKKRFVQLYGSPPYVYLRRRRMETASFLLRTSALSITEIASQVGYQNASKFSRAFSEIYGISPSDCKKGVRLEQYDLSE